MYHMMYSRSTYKAAVLFSRGLANILLCSIASVTPPFITLAIRAGPLEIRRLTPSG